MGAPDEAAIVGNLKEVAQFLPVLEGGLAGKEWIAGSLNIADFALATTFMYREPARIARGDPERRGLDRPARGAAVMAGGRGADHGVDGGMSPLSS